MRTFFVPLPRQVVFLFVQVGHCLRLCNAGVSTSMQTEDKESKHCVGAIMPGPSFPNTHPPCSLPSQHRYITAHNEDGFSVFSSAFPATTSYTSITPDLDVFLGYITSTFPVRMASDIDLADYHHFFEDNTGPIANRGGTVLRSCNFAPGTTTAMHRTSSLDFGVVVAGEIELVLDSGQVRLLKVGDIAVQRGTMHAWRVPSKAHWARMAFVLQDAEPVEVDGRKLREDYGGIPLSPTGT